MAAPQLLRHPVTRRGLLQAGGIGLIGLSLDDVHALRAASPTASAASPGDRRSVIYIFLSGGLAQHDSFDLKPEATDSIRMDRNQAQLDSGHLPQKPTGSMCCRRRPHCSRSSWQGA